MATGSLKALRLVDWISLQPLFECSWVQRPMKRKSFIQSPQELRNSMKVVINLKNKDNECFRWCHIRYLNLQSKDSQLIQKVNTAFVDQLDYSNIEFPVDVKQYSKIEKQSNINIIVFGYENKRYVLILIDSCLTKQNINTNIFLYALPSVY